MQPGSQAALWNDAVGAAWVRHADWYDTTLAPFGRAVMTQLDIQSGERVLDLGCGTGSTTVDLATLAAPGEVVGVDVSAPMLDEARRRLDAEGVANARVVEADLQADELDAGAYDVAFSRFGVMFFEDPVRAFTNVARALVPGGYLGFVCFQGPPANPFIVVPVLAAAAHLELPPMPAPDAPGPFSLAEPDRIRQVLEAAGFVDVAIGEGPPEAILTGADDLDALAVRVLEQNPATGPALLAASPEVRESAIAAVAAALGEHRAADQVRLGAGTWIVTARTPG